MKLSLSTVVSIVSLLAILLSVALTFGTQMERLDRVRDDIRELKEQVRQVMVAVGSIEHARWREKQGDK